MSEPEPLRSMQKASENVPLANQEAGAVYPHFPSPLTEGGPKRVHILPPCPL